MSEDQPASSQSHDADDLQAEDQEFAAAGAAAPTLRGSRFRRPLLEALQNRRLIQLTEAELFANPDSGTPDDDRFYTQLESGGVMDMPAGVQFEVQRLSLMSFRKNVRAFCAVELVKDFSLGDGVRFRAADPRVQDLLVRHWEANEWEDRMEERVRGLGIFGEALLPAFTRQTDGFVRVTSVTPLRISGVSRNAQDGADLKRVRVGGNLNFPVSPFAGGGAAEVTEARGFDIIKRNADGELEGDAFFFAVNRVDGQARGTPDLCSSLDWLEGLDGFLFSMLERAELSQDVVYDIEYGNLNEEQLRKKVREFAKALRSGGIWAHNEKASLDIKSPKLGAADIQGVVSILMRQIQSGTRLAGLFFGDSADLTRASASELSVPVAKAIQGRQNFIRRMLARIFSYQIQQARKAGALEGVRDFSFEIQMPRIFLKDLATVAKGLNDLGNALRLAVDADWLTNDQAGDVFRSQLEEVAGLALDDPASLGAPEPDVQEHEDRTLRALRTASDG